MRITLLFLLMSVSTSALADANTFWRHWSDGQAEVSGYTLSQPRYGETRVGTAILIFVTEPFSRSRAVKVDRYNPKDPDQFTAFKLNHLQRFRTGVYDYSVMTSVFTDPSKSFGPVKQVFSSQEWCGQVYEETLWSEGKASVRVDSYFEGESRTGVMVGRAASEDALWIQARGLMASGPGSSLMRGPMLGRGQIRRLRHQEIGTFKPQLAWSEPRSLTVPAGTYRIRELAWVRGDKSRCRLHVEIAAPHRVIGWSCDDGESAQLTGSLRMPYWNQVRSIDERLLKALGLPGS